MFYENNLPIKNIKVKNSKLALFGSIDYDDKASQLPLEKSMMITNFGSCGDALVDGLGIADLSFRYDKNFPNDRKAIDGLAGGYYYKAAWRFCMQDISSGGYMTFLILQSSNGDFYFNRLDTSSSSVTRIDDLNLSDVPLVTVYNIGGRDSLILVSKSKGMYVWQYPQNVIKVDNVPLMSSMCIINDRLFVTVYDDVYKIYYSDNLDPTNFNISSREGGIIELPIEMGKCNKVVSFDGDLYVFRDFGISRISTYGDPKEFEVVSSIVSNGRIFEKTVCVCGDKILYLASDGLYKFDGNKSTKIDTGVNSLLNNASQDYSVAGFCDGYYYLSCNLDYQDNVHLPEGSYNNNSFIRYNVTCGMLDILCGYDVMDIYIINDTIESSVCVLSRKPGSIYRFGTVGILGKYFNENTSKVWQSHKVDMSTNKDKILKSLSLETRQDIEVVVRTDCGDKIINVAGRVGIQDIRVNIKCKWFAIDIVSKGVNNYICHPYVSVGV
ncbi:MAG: hypothetical protein E7356_00840 [Clostridiales bacterium]|nr:hypothetical protein [Clostridiales bacterium]